MTCPFCKNDLLAGATVCGHCGAHQRGSPRWYAGLIFAIGAFMMVMSAFTPLGFGLSRIKGIPVIMLGGLLVLLAIIIPKRPVWRMR